MGCGREGDVTGVILGALTSVQDASSVSRFPYTYTFRPSPVSPPVSAGSKRRSRHPRSLDVACPSRRTAEALNTSTHEVRKHAAVPDSQLSLRELWAVQILLFNTDAAKSHKRPVSSSPGPVSPRLHRKSWPPVMNQFETRATEDTAASILRC